MKIKVCAVKYLNAAPLWWAMKKKKSVELTLGAPDKTAGFLKKGEADIAIVPTYEFVRKRFLMAGAFGVLSDGPVKSVLLFYKRKVSEIKTIYLDPTSRTSQAMTKFLFSGGEMVFLKTGRLPKNLKEGEATLMIGDKALTHFYDDIPKIDIASLWRKRTKKPALFALWAAKEGKPAFDVEDFISSSFIESMKQIDEIVEFGMTKTGMKKEFIRSYLTESLFYRFGEKGDDALSFYKKVFG